MATFYQLIPDNIFYESIEPENLNAPEWGTQPIMNGSPYGASFPKYILRTAEHQKNVSDFFACAGFMVISNRAKCLLERYSKTLEFLPVTVISFKNGPYQGQPYWLVHHLCALDCIDKKKSKYTTCFYNEKLIDDVEKLVFDESKTKNEHVFVPQGMLSTFVSASLKSEIETEDFAGLDFTPIENVWH